MTCRTEIADEQAYRLCPDARRTAAESIVLLHVTDEITRRAPIADLHVRTTRAALGPRVAMDGVCGLVGDPARVFSVSNVAIDVDVEVRAAGYLPWRDTLSVNGNALPQARDVALHREGTRVTGSVVQLVGFDQVPLAGATVSLDGVWAESPPAGAVVPADPPAVVSLAPGLYAARPSSLGTVARRDLTLDLPGAKKLIRPADAGQTYIWIDNRQALGTTQLVAVDQGDPDRVELLPISSIDGFSTDDQPARVWLGHPLASSHREGARVVAATLAAPATATPLTRDAIPGDVCAFVSSPVNLAGATVIEISGGTAAPEYQTMRRYESVTGATGVYRWPPLARVARIRLAVAHPSIPTLKPVSSVAYDAGEYRFDVITT